MGCFASTCPISGLSIQYKDPVRFAILERSSRTERGALCYSTDLFRFWTPCFKSIYNDYGSVEWHQIEDREQFEYLLELFRPSLRNRTDYSHNLVIEDLPPETLFASMIHQQLVFDPSREMRNKPDLTLLQKLKIREQKDFYFFLVHDWAFQFLLNLKQRDGYLQKLLMQIDYFVKTDNEKHVEFDEAVKDLPRDSDEWNFHFSRMSSQDFISWLDGTDAPFDSFQELFYESQTLKFKSDFKQKILDTAIFTHRLFDIRKLLSPATTIGASQSERNEEIKPWLELLSQKAKEQFKEFE